MRCNNDHGVSPDGKWLAISDQSQGDHQSIIYILPVEWRNAEARDAEIAFVLARLVAGRQDARLSGATQR